MITYALLVGRPPFETNDIKTTYQKIKSCNYSFPESINISEEAKIFVSRMLQLNPSRRANIEEVLNDPFLLEAGIPLSLPISSLACPPSFDFISKYRQAQEAYTNRYRTANESLEKC